jgi:hypothetical protein
MSKTIEHGWELRLPAGTPEQMLAVLAARDRLFGQTITHEAEEGSGDAVEAWFGTVEALDNDHVRLDVLAEVTGPSELLDAAVEALQDLLSELVSEGEQDAKEATLIGRRKAAEVRFVKVENEDDERPDLIVPTWLAPDIEIEVPWQLQPVDRSGARWPGDGILGEHGRVFVVPSGDELLLYGLPELEDDEEEAE